MKLNIFSELFLAVSLLSSTASGFSVAPSSGALKTTSSSALKASPDDGSGGGGGLVTSYPGPSDDFYEMYQDLEAIKWENIEGGGTIRTYAMPAWADRLQYQICSHGRPLRAEAQIWLGPLRKVHTCTIDNENGDMNPFMTTMKFKQQSPVLKISTTDGVEYPCRVKVSVPSPERAKELAKNTERIWNECPEGSKLLIQGGRVGKKGAEGGAYRCWQVPANVESVQMIGWSKDVSQKSFKLKIEILQSANCNKQTYDMQCGGGSQPFHCIFQTPGDGWVIRIYNKKFMEDGLTQMCILPMKTIGPAPAELPVFESYGTGDAEGIPGFTQPSMHMGGTASGKQWWE